MSFPVPEAGNGVRDGAQVQVLAQDDQHHGKEDEQDTDNQAGREHLTEDHHTDSHSRQRLQRTQDSGGRSPHMMHSHGHEYQRQDGGHDAQPYGE